jgi:hypothetical protein
MLSLALVNIPDKIFVIVFVKDVNNLFIFTPLMI